MAITADRFDFHPPRAQGNGRAFSLAMLAHLLLAGALTWGVSWKREATLTTVEAELWSSLPQQAAPKLIEVAPPPPAPQPKVETLPEPPAPKPPDIAVEKVKPKPPPPKVEPKVEPKSETKPVAKPVEKPAPKPDPKVNKALDERKLAAQREKERLDNIQRMAGLAGASSAPNAQGNSYQTSGMSTNWNAKLKARVNPKIIYSGDRSQLKDLELNISIFSDGTIARRPDILKSSGNPQWDQAVIRAFENAEILPRDANGKLPPSPFRLTWIARE